MRPRCVMKWNLIINQKLLLLFYYFVLLNHNQILLIKCDVFKLGYLTGSQRRSGDLEYQRPGKF